MKTCRQIYDQRQRVFHALMDRTMRRVKIAHPETGGNLLMVHNWGNTQSKQIESDSWVSWRKLDAAFDAAYSIAEHRTHGDNFRPMWCQYCKE